MTAAETARAGLVLIDHGVKKLRDAGLDELADRIDAVIAQALAEAQDEVQASKALASLHAGSACGEP